jgi:hypothetical protein
LTALTNERFSGRLQAFGNIQFDPFDIEITPLTGVQHLPAAWVSASGYRLHWGKNIIDADITEDTTDLVNEVDALGWALVTMLLPRYRRERGLTS